MNTVGATKIIDYNSLQNPGAGDVDFLSITVDFQSKFPDWGPWFNSKCIIGYKYFSYMVD